MLPQEHCPRVDSFIQLDYSDESRLHEALSKLNIEAVISGANDFALLAAIRASELFGTSGPDMDEQIWSMLHDKLHLRRCLNIAKAGGVNFYDPEVASWASSEIPRIALSKPRLSSGGRGIQKVQNVNSFTGKELLSLSKRGFVVEEFIRGNLFSYFEFIGEQNSIRFFAREFTRDYAVVEARTPAKLSERSKDQVVHDIDALRHLTGYRVGLLHTQFMVGRDETPKIIEVTGRIPGDNYLNLVHASSMSLSPAVYSRALRSKEGVSLPLSNFGEPARTYMSRQVLEIDSETPPKWFLPLGRLITRGEFTICGSGKRLNKKSVFVFLANSRFSCQANTVSLILRSLNRVLRYFAVRHSLRGSEKQSRTVD